MKKGSLILNIVFGVIILLGIIAAYLKYAISKFDYDFSLNSYTPVKINVKGDSIIRIVLDLSLKSAFFFSVPVNSLYYEVYYKGGLLGKSANITSFTLIPNEFVHVTEPVDIYINNENAQVAINYISKIPTDFIAKIKVSVLGIPIKLTELKLTY